MASFFAVMLMAEVTRTRYSPVAPDYHGTNVILLGGLIIGVLVTAGVIRRFRRTRVSADRRGS